MTPTNRLPDYIGHMQQAAAQAVGYVQGMDLAARLPAVLHAAQKVPVPPATPP